MNFNIEMNQFFDTFAIFALTVICYKEENQQLVNRKVCSELKILGRYLERGNKNSDYGDLWGWKSR